MSLYEWLDLEAEIEASWVNENLAGNRYQRVNDVHRNPIVLLGYNDAGLPIALVPFRESDEKAPPVDSIVLEVSTIHRGFEGIDGRKFAQVLCRELQLEGVFKDLILQLVKNCRETEETPISTLANLVQEWRQLLHKNALSNARRNRIGLIGELEVLRRLAAVDPIMALDRWQGPDGHMHDFVSPHLDIEVKTTALTKSNVLHLNGLAQLKEIGSTGLVLARVRVTEHPAGTTVNDRVDELVHAGVSRSFLEEKISKVVPNELLSQIDDQAVVVTGFDMYRVDDSFPRVDVIDPATGDFPAGILDVAVDIDLSVAPRLSPDEIHDVVVKMVESVKEESC